MNELWSHTYERDDMTIPKSRWCLRYGHILTFLVNAEARRQQRKISLCAKRAEFSAVSGLKSKWLFANPAVCCKTLFKSCEWPVENLFRWIIKELSWFPEFIRDSLWKKNASAWAECPGWLYPGRFAWTTAAKKLKYIFMPSLSKLVSAVGASFIRNGKSIHRLLRANNSLDFSE